MVQLNSAITTKLEGLADGVLNGHYLFDGNSDSYLEQRFSKPEKHARNIKSGVFDDPKLTEQYYQIREEAYRKDLCIPEFDGSEDYLDRLSYKYLAVAGSNCVGGLRVTVSRPAFPVMMPMESGDFSIRDHFPEINFDSLMYCECSRLGLLPEYRVGNLWDEIQQGVTKFMINELGVEVLFGRSSVVQTRMFKSQFSRMGLSLILRSDIKANYVKSYDHLNMQFWAVDFTKNRKYHDILAGKAVKNYQPEEVFAAFA